MFPKPMRVVTSRQNSVDCGSPRSVTPFRLQDGNGGNVAPRGVVAGHDQPLDARPERADAEQADERQNQVVERRHGFLVSFFQFRTTESKNVLPPMMTGPQ